MMNPLKGLGVNNRLGNNLDKQSGPFELNGPLHIGGGDKI